MPQHTLEERIKARRRELLQETNENPPEVDQSLKERVAARRLSLRVERRKKEILENREEPKDKVGFFEGLGNFLELSVRGAMFPHTLTPEDFAARSAIGAGAIEEGLIEPARGLLELPGLLTTMELPTDRAAKFLERAQVGLYSNIEEQALKAGLTEGEISAYHTVGDLVGMTAPILASVGAAKLLLRDPSKITRWVQAGNIITDMTAGAIYGGVLSPGDDIKSRMKHMLGESAAFGIGRAALSGLALPFNGWRLQKYSDLRAREEAENLIRRVLAGEDITFGEGESATVTRLLSEEGFVMSSFEAQEMVRVFQDERALIQGLVDAQTSEAEMGIVRSIGRDFSEVSGILEKFKGEFPRLKFEAVKGKEGVYDVFFGPKGLSNAQKAHFKKHGRIPGQVIEKAGAKYEYVRPSNKKGKIVAKNSNGKTVTLSDEGITDSFGIVQETDDSALQQLFDSFMEDLPGIMDEISKVGSAWLPEEDLIKAIQSGALTPEDFALGRRQAGDIGFAVTMPEEAGVSIQGEAVAARLLEEGFQAGGTLPSRRVVSFDEMVELWARRKGLGVSAGDEYVVRIQRETPLGDGLEGDEFAYGILDQSGERVGYAVGKMYDGLVNITETAATSNQPGALGTGTVRDVARQIVHDLRSQGFKPERIAGTRASGTQPGKIAEIDVESLMKGDPVEVAADFDAMKSYFGQKARQEFWKAVPDEDRIVFEQIQSEFHNLVESGDIPFEALAHNKGFAVLREGDRVILRDLNSGSRLSFGSEAAAKEAVLHTVRPEKDLLGGSILPPGSHGIGGMTGGFDPTDGVFTFGDDITHDLIEDMPLFSGIRNMRDVFIDIETRTGVPMYSQVFDKLDEGLTAQRNFVQPWAEKIRDVWKGLSRKDKREVVEFWKSIEGEDIGLAQAIQRAQRHGLSSKQVTAFRKSHQMFDVWHQLSGLPKQQYIPFYFSRIQPINHARGGSVSEKAIRGTNLPPQFDWWASHTRTGNLAVVEMDPEIVMHKYVRSLGFRRHVESYYNAARELTAKSTTPKIGDLPPGVQADIMSRREGVTKSTPILGQHVRDVLSEYLNIVRGSPTSSQSTARRFMKNLLGKLGVRVNEHVVDEYANVALQNMYGAAMALRPALTARNAVQNVWLMYGRLGARHGGTAMERALTREGYQEVLEAFAIRNTEAGIPSADAVWGEFLEKTPIEGSGILGSAIAGALRLGLRAGKLSGRIARKGLVPYSSTDDMNRAWAYWWQKLHTEELLAKYEGGRISWEKFLDDGLPFFHNRIKQGFTQRYHKFGREGALRWIGKQASDESNFIYGVGAQPAWMQKTFGRFLGMFGTWPIWALEMYAPWRRFGTGTMKHQAAFTARSLAMIGAFANMTIQSGINLWSWIAPASFMGWTGGPVVDHILQLKRVIDLPFDQKADGLGDLAAQVGRLSYPGQIFFTRDIPEALDSDNALEAGMKLMLGRPVDDPEWPMEFMFGDQFDGEPLTPEGRDALLNMEAPRIPLLSPEPLGAEEVPRPLPATPGSITPGQPDTGVPTVRPDLEEG